MAKKLTFAEAKTIILEDLRRKGWSVVTFARGRTLKVPHATSPNGRKRYWFKAQSIYSTEGSNDMGDARSEHADMRDVAASILARDGS